MTDRAIINTSGDFAGTAIAAWLPLNAYVLNDLVVNDTPAQIYICTTAGNSAAAGGPTGTGDGIADGTVVWNHYGTTGASASAVPQQLLDSGWPINAILASQYWNQLWQDADAMLKHLEESRGPDGGRFDNCATAPAVVDNGGGAGRVIAWSAFDADLTKTVAGDGGERRIAIASGTLDLATDDTHYIYVDAADNTVKNSTTNTDMFDGAPMAQVVTAGGNISSIIQLDRGPVPIDGTTDILVGAKPHAHFINLQAALIYGKALQDSLASSALITVRLVSDLSNAETYSVTGGELFSNLCIDLGGNLLTLTANAADFFTLDDDIDHFTIRNGRILATAAAAQDFIASGDVAKTLEDITLERLEIVNDGSQEMRRFVYFVNTTGAGRTISRFKIMDCNTWTTDSCIRFLTQANDTVEDVDVDRLSARRVNASGTEVPVEFNQVAGAGTIDRVHLERVKVFASPTTGMLLQGEFHNARHCYIYDWVDGGIGIDMDADHSIIDQCIVDGSSTAGNATGIRSSGTRSNITGNSISNVTGGTTIGIDTSGGTYHAITGNNCGGANTAISPDGGATDELGTSAAVSPGCNNA
jgi:hypothetical protein